MGMSINERTKLSELLKHHPDALEAIVSLSPDFKKLRNPVLRALMAGRTTIAMASKMGGIGPSDFFRALEALGFESEASQGSLSQEPVPKNIPRPEALKSLAAERLVSFDVRSILADGKDPLRPIQQRVKSLKAGEVLLIVNTFEPVPLIKVLEKQGFQSHVEVLAPDRVETYFYRLEGEGAPMGEVQVGEEEGSTSGDWEPLLERFAGNLQEIDVRHLEMPMPMMTILEALETLPQGKALYVYHKRIPVFLLTELRERNFDYRIREVGDGEVYLLIFANQ